MFKISALFLFLFHQEKDAYGNEVQRLGRPLPVEYLLVDIPASTPVQQVHTFAAREDKGYFPVENRFLDGHIQDFNALSSYLSKWTIDEFLEVSNILIFHKNHNIYRNARVVKVSFLKAAISIETRFLFC